MESKYLDKVNELQNEDFPIVKLMLAYELSCHDEDYACDEIVDWAYSAWLKSDSCTIEEIAQAIERVITEQCDGSVAEFLIASEEKGGIDLYEEGGL